MYDVYLTTINSKTAYVIRNLDYDDAEKVSYKWLKPLETDYFWVNAGEKPKFLNAYDNIIEKPVSWINNF